MNKPKAQQLAAWVFGFCVFAFLVVVFWIDPKLSATRARVACLFGALLAGLFGYFITGSIKLFSEGSQPKFGKVAVQATGGAVLSVFVFLVSSWQLAPLENQFNSDLKKSLKNLEDHTGVEGELR